EHGLEEVVEGVALEGADGVLVEGGDEHDAVRVVAGQAGDEVEAAFAAEPDVEKHEVGAMPFREREGLGDVGGLADDPDAGVDGEEPSQFEAGGGFVVDQEAAHGVKGSSMRKRTQPSAAVRASVAASPWSR